MNLETRSQIARATLSVLTVVVAVFLLGLLVLVLCSGLQINPFKETTTSFLIASFAGLIGVATVLVLLNVAVNISLIAEARIAELKLGPSRPVMGKWGLAFVVVALAIVGLIFGGTYLSKERYSAVVRGQADEVLKQNKDLLDQVGQLLASGKPADYKKIFEIRSFLENQRSGLPQLNLIYSGKFGDKLAFYSISGDYFPGDLNKGLYTPAYFRCTRNLDCDYLKQFFTGQNVLVMQKYTMREDQFYTYIPITGKDARFVLLFEKTNAYGKIGS